MRVLLKRFFKPQASITAAAGIIAAASLLSRLLGVFRDRILASEFGAGDTLDMYYAAFKAPDFIYNLIIVGALSAGFIPVFVSYKDRGKNEQWELASVFLSAVVVFLGVFAFIGIIFADTLLMFIAPGFEPEKIAGAAALTRIMFLSPLFLGISAVFGGVLQAYRRFFVFALAPIFYNVGIIIGVLFFVPYLGIVGLAWGVVFGAFLHLSVQLPTVLRMGWRPWPVWQLQHSGFREIVRLTIPRTLSLATAQINLLLLTVIASFLSVGSIAIFTLASNLYFVPIALFGISYAIAVYPTLTEQARKKNSAMLIATVASTVKHILFFIIPFTVVYFLLRAQIVRIILGSGAFDWKDTVLTVDTLWWLSFSLFAHALIPLLARVFYAYKNTVKPFIVGVVADMVTVSSSWLLGQHLGVAGLGLAFSLGAFVHVIVLWLLLRSKLGSLGEMQIMKSVTQFLVAAMPMAFVLQGVKEGLGHLIGTSTFLAITFQGIAAGIAGVTTYVLFLLLLQNNELQQVITAITQRFKPLPLDEGIKESEGM